MRSTLAVLSVVLFAAGCNLGKESNYSFCDSSGCYTCDSNGCIAATPTDPNGNPIGDGYCYQDSDCPSDSFCDNRSGYCYPAYSCSVDADCGQGMVCDGRDTCVPGPSTCNATSPCAEGCYCSSGSCVETSLCAFDSDCEYLGSGFACSNGTCAPVATDGGTADGGTADGGSVGNSDMGSTDGGVSPDAGRMACTSDGDCASSEVCHHGFCRTTCAVDSDCSSGKCTSSHVCR
ncbi:MAG: hypothetical protein ABI321_00440 [Polyangia bacterium]